MYGMLLESIQLLIQGRYGAVCWALVLERACLPPHLVFSVHERYSHRLIPDLAAACAAVITPTDYHADVDVGANDGSTSPIDDAGRLLPPSRRPPPSSTSSSPKTADDFLQLFGEYFVGYFTRYGYGRVMRASGRHLRDFLHGIDQLHETMRFAYRRMQSPSFYVSAEDADGCLLEYRSRRVGYAPYVVGQLRQCARAFYGVDVRVEVQKCEDLAAGGGCHVVFRLDFDNSAYAAMCDEQLRRSTAFQTPSAASTGCGDVVDYTSIKVSTFLKVFIIWMK